MAAHQFGLAEANVLHITLGEAGPLVVLVPHGMTPNQALIAFWRAYFPDGGPCQKENESNWSDTDILGMESAEIGYSWEILPLYEIDGKPV